jgi:hypothetical protein
LRRKVDKSLADLEKISKFSTWTSLEWRGGADEQILHSLLLNLDSRQNLLLSYGSQRQELSSFWFGGIGRNPYSGYQKAGSPR